MKKFAIATVGMLLVLTGCSTSPGAQKIDECLSEGSYGAGCVTTIQYNGNPLNCVTWDGSHGETGLTCDFVEYNRLYGPEPLTH